jgi:hypothetical protein
MPRSCTETALALIACMQQGKCMQSGGKVQECIQSEDLHQCQVCTKAPIYRGTCLALIHGPRQVQRNAYFECKRSQLDMRTRIRGTRVY